MTMEENSVLGNEKQSCPGKGVLRGASGRQRAKEIAVAVFALVFCLKELFTLNCRLNVLIQVKGEDKRRNLLFLENPRRHYTRMH